jgi:hypothetical protein
VYVHRDSCEPAQERASAGQPPAIVKQYFNRAPHGYPAQSEKALLNDGYRHAGLCSVGGAFALYGGYITGRHVELVPNVRVVQAWRTGGWPPGVYSIAKFELVELRSGSKIVFDHTGFPKGEAESLASEWKAHYWEPLAKVLA